MITVLIVIFKRNITIIWYHCLDILVQAMEKMVGNIIQKEKQIDFIVVGPIDNRNKIVKGMT